MIMNSYATFRDLWIYIWIHVYEEYREIIPEIMCTKVPDAVSVLCQPFLFKLFKVRINWLPCLWKACSICTAASETVKLTTGVADVDCVHCSCQVDHTRCNIIPQQIEGSTQGDYSWDDLQVNIVSWWQKTYCISIMPAFCACCHSEESLRTANFILCAVSEL